MDLSKDNVHLIF